MVQKVCSESLDNTLANYKLKYQQAYSVLKTLHAIYGISFSEIRPHLSKFLQLDTTMNILPRVELGRILGFDGDIYNA